MIVNVYVPLFTRTTQESFHLPIQLPSDPCWPSSQEWASFNETVSSRLIRTVPLASVCYKSEPNFNNEACSAILADWTSSAFHAADPASVGDLTWTNSSCLPIYPNGTSVGGDPDAGKKGCSIGNFSPYVVNATEAGHVQAAFKFAEKHNLRFNIKNTGHNPEKRFVPIICEIVPLPPVSSLTRATALLTEVYRTYNCEFQRILR